MNLREMGVPDACYFGCPSIDFRALEATVAEKEADLARAKEADVSDSDRRALQRQVAGAIGDAVAAVEKMPTEAEPAPWRITIPEDVDPATQMRIQPLRCCHYAGVVVLNLTAKPHQVIEINRPG